MKGTAKILIICLIAVARHIYVSKWQLVDLYDGYDSTHSAVDIASENDATKAEPESAGNLAGTPDTAEVKGVEVKLANKPTSIQEQRIEKPISQPSELKPPSVPACALLFFGLPKQFKEKALPSIREYILGPNPTCDVYVHTYNKGFISNARNGEKNSTLHTNEVYLLPNATIMRETENALLQKHNLTYYHQFCPVSWECPTSMDNMIKQWYSIEQVWSLMRQPYSQVGLFRLDVHYTNPINISDSAAAVPNWGHFKGINDRMFYGRYDNARVWANSRFPLVEKWVKIKQSNMELYSERYLRYALKDSNISFEEKPICFHRLRATGEELVNDCK